MHRRYEILFKIKMPMYEGNVHVRRLGVGGRETK